MGKMTESAAGAILNIPPAAVNAIKDAERAIWSLHDASRKAADQIYGDFSKRMPMGVDVFIRKLAEAQTAIDKISGKHIELNVNTNNSAGKVNETANQIKADMNAISATVQLMARSFDFTRPEQSFRNFFTTIGELEAALKNFQQERRQMNLDDPEINRIKRIIELMKEFIEVNKQSKETQTAVTQKANDKTYLEEQKRLLGDLLNMRKQINAQSAKVQSGRITDAGNLKQEEADLRTLFARYREIYQKLQELNAEKRNGLSASGQTKAEVNEEKYRNEVLKQQLTYRQQLSAEIIRANEMVAQGQQGKTRMGSSEEAAIQRQLNSDYKAMLKIIKEQGELKAKAAAEGRQLTQEEINLVAVLTQRYKIYYDDVNRIAGAYKNIAAAAAQNFQADKSAQLARNAIMLADANEKAALSAQKVTDARNAQRQKQADQDSARIANAQAQAENEVNNILNRRIELQQKITALNTKQSIAALSDPTAKLGFADSANLAKYERQMSDLETRLRAIGVLYPKLARDSELAFNTQKAELLALSLQKVAEVQANIASGKTTAKSSDAENRLNELYTQRLKLLKEKEQLENKAIINQAKGLPDLTAKENQLLAEVTAKIATIEGQINTIGQTYAGLAAKAKHAFALDELRQSIALAARLDAALTRIDDANIRKLVSEYKTLTSQANSLASTIKKAQEAGVSKTDPNLKALRDERAMVLLQMRDLERKNIQEIADFRRQKDVEATQRSVSDFIQAEAKKTAEAKRQAEIQSNDRIAAYQRYLNTYQGAMAAANKLGTRGGAYADTYENRERVIKNLEAAIKSLDKADADYENNLRNLIAALQRLKAAQKAVSDAAKPSKNSKPLVSPQDAINAAKQARTLEQLKNAHQQLKAVMDSTNPKSNEWLRMNKVYLETGNRINTIRKKMGELNSESNRLGNALGGLGRRIAAVFSVQQIYGFLKKMTEVRAQFELQRVALGAIIQDRDEANKIFVQVQNMALESPFNIMQLEKATKQIAAFGFETKKLVPTMKMFADISAGLGVEIDRLVLVMGHLKARNFLEGTMVRQFTNMGFNILGELSKYYTELENKMVSVGEVQDRVKKKMVSFGDVEAVLKRVTSAGGMFYDMQKQQSNSIWGMMQRITDAYDLMLNEIGQSNESTIKAVLTVIRELISSWRELKPYIVGVVTALGTYATVSVAMKILPIILANTRNGFILLAKSIGLAKNAQTALNVTMLHNPYAAAAAAVLSLLVVIGQLITKQNQLTEAMDRVRSEGYGNMYGLITQYKELADTVKDANEPYAERKEALEELKRVFGDILPQQLLEIDYIKQTADGYKEATEAIKAYSAEKIKANLQSEIDNISGKEVSKEIDYVADVLADTAEDFLPRNMPKDTFKQIIDAMLEQMKTEVKSGDLKIEDFWHEFNERVMSKFEVIIPRDKMDKILRHPVMHEAMAYLFDDLKTYSAELKGIDLGLGDIESPQLVEVKEHYEALTKAVKDYKDAMTALREAKKSGSLTSVTEENGIWSADKDAKQEGQDAVNNMVAKLKTLYETASWFHNEWRATAADVNDAIQSQSQELNLFEKVSSNVLVEVTKNMGRLNKSLQTNAVENYFDTMQSEADKMDLTGPQQKLYDIGAALALQMGIQIGVLDRLRLESINSFEDAAKAAHKEEEQLHQNIQAMETMIKNMMLYQGLSYMDAKGLAEQWYGGGSTLEQNKQAEQFMATFKKLVGYVDRSRQNASKKSKSTTDKELKRLQDLKKRLEEVNKQYEDLRKTMSEEEANKRIHELFDPIFKDLGFSLDDFFKDGEYGAEALIKALDILLKKFKRSSQERKEFASDIEEEIAETKIDIDTKKAEKRIEEVKKKIDNLFSSYELSKELEDLGLNVNMTFMLGGEPIDLRELKARLTAGFDEIGREKGPEEEVKNYKEAFKKITEIELKEQKERVKKYYKYTVNALGERAKIELEYLKQIDEVRETYALTENQRQEAITNLREEQNRKIAQQAWKDFKEGTIYQMMFDDIEKMPEKALKTLREQLKDKLETSGPSLSFREIKEINNAIDTIDKQLAKSNPLRTLSDSIEKLIRLSPDIEKTEEDFSELARRIGELQDRNVEIEVELNLARDKSALYKIEQIDEEIQKLFEEETRLRDEENVPDDDARLQELQKENGLLHEKRKLLEDIANLNYDGEQKLYDRIQDLQEEYDHNNAELKGGTYNGWDYGDGLEKELEKAYSKLQAIADVTNAIEQALGYIHEYVDTTLKSIDSIVTGLDDMVGLSDGVKDAWSSINDIFSATEETLTNFANLGTAILTKKPKQIIQSSLQSIGSVIKLIGSFTKIGDNKKERQIVRLKERVEELKKAYENLEEAMDEAFTFDEYNSSYKAAMEALDSQAQAYDEMIRLEEAKKKTDKDKLKEYKEAREEVEKARKELEKSRYEEYGSISKKDYQNEAEAFVSAWLDAYKETGDGLDGLTEHWDEFFNNLVLKQAASSVVSKRMAKYIDMINAAIDRGETGLSFAETVKNIGEQFKNEMGAVNEGLKEFWETLGLSGGSGEFVLSDLQKGIQNITEPQAAAIEAYLNSIRFEIYNHTRLLNTLVSSIQMQYGGNEETPMLTELKGIHNVLDDIYSALRSVVRTEFGRTVIQVG